MNQEKKKNQKKKKNQNHHDFDGSGYGYGYGFQKLLLRIAAHPCFGNPIHGSIIANPCIIIDPVALSCGLTVDHHSDSLIRPNCSRIRVKSSINADCKSPLIGVTGLMADNGDPINYPNCNRLMGDGLSIKCKESITPNYNRFVAMGDGLSSEYCDEESITPNYNRLVGGGFTIDCDGSPRGVLDLKLLIESDDSESDNEIEDIIALVDEYSMLNLTSQLILLGGKRYEEEELVTKNDQESVNQKAPIDWITVRSSIGWSAEDRQEIKPFVAMALQQEKKLYAERSIAFLSSLSQRISTTN